MEKEQKVDIPRKKRKTSLFRRRKKAEIRPFVRAKKQYQLSKILRLFLLVILAIFCITAIIFATKELILPKILYRSERLVSPQGSQYLTQKQIELLLTDMNIDSLKVKLYGDVITFTLNKKVNVFITQKKDIKQQLVLVLAIDKQITLDGKQAILIDLRYNKPIVKF